MIKYVIARVIDWCRPGSVPLSQVGYPEPSDHDVWQDHETVKKAIIIEYRPWRNTFSDRMDASRSLFLGQFSKPV